MRSISRRGSAGALRRVFDALEDERSAAREAMLRALQSERYLDLLDRIENAVESPSFAESDPTLRDVAATEFRKLRKAVRRLPEKPSDEELHEIRKRGKRARYAAELAESSVGKSAAEFVREAKAFQDVLGEHQDAVVAEDRIRETLHGTRGSGLAFAAGRLVEQERARKKAARAAFPEAWKQLKRRGRKAWS